MAFLIVNGTIVTADQTCQADILVEGERIAEIGPDLHTRYAVKAFNASGFYVLPGGVDVHTHFDLPMFGTVSADDHYSGHKAAAFGGTTTVLDFIPQDLPTLLSNVEAWHEKADAKAAIDFGFHMNISALNPTVEKEIPALVREGITTLKVFTAYNNRLRISDAEIFKVMRISEKNGMLTMLHAENGDVIDLLVDEAVRGGKTSPIWHARTRPAWGAVEGTFRGIALAAQADAALYVVHMNASGEVDQLAYAREKGLRVMGETCPQYLYFSEADLEKPDGAKWICSPPLRGVEDQQALWRGLEEGVIQVIATDHCSFFFDGRHEIDYEDERIKIAGKELGAADFTKIPNGLPGVGDRMPILWTHRPKAISINRYVALNCTHPAKIFGMYPQKGEIRVGSDADLVLWNAERQVTYGKQIAQHRIDHNLYEGWQLTGFPERVFLRGQLIVDRGVWLGKAGMGRYLKRTPGAPIL